MEISRIRHIYNSPTTLPPRLVYLYIFNAQNEKGGYFPTDPEFFFLKSFSHRRKYIFIFFCLPHIYTHSMEKDYILRVFAIVLAIVTTTSIPLMYPELPSLSQCWTTPLQATFIFSNVVTSYLFLSLNSWKYPALFLLLLTSFSYVSFPILHNVFAVLFFFTSVYSLWHVKRLPVYYWLFCFSLVFMFFSLIWGEVFGILTLCAYHYHLLSYKKKLYSRNL